jgi:hypothetical protein
MRRFGELLRQQSPKPGQQRFFRDGIGVRAVSRCLINDGFYSEVGFGPYLASEASAIAADANNKYRPMNPLPFRCVDAPFFGVIRPMAAGTRPICDRFVFAPSQESSPSRRPLVGDRLSGE